MSDTTKPKRIIPPTRLSPNEKEEMSPIMPIPVGMAPPPIRKAKGMVSEIATLRELAGPMHERAANPAGKKQTASMGCKKTVITSQ